MAGAGRDNADALVLAALASGATVAEAANQAGVSVRTVYRRRADQDFRRALADAQSALVAATTSELTEAATRAATTLRDLLDPRYSASVRLAAARAVLESALKYREAVGLDERVAELEAALALSAEMDDDTVAA